MAKQKNESHKVILGVAISTVIGAGLLYYMNSKRHRPTPILKKIGKAMVEMGEMLEHCNTGSCKEVVAQIEERVPQAGDLASNAMSWVSTGMNLWKALNKGR